MIFATFHDPDATIEAELADGVEQSRTIRGTAVPWNQVGLVSDGRKVRFYPGSLPADASPIVTLGHTGPAIGVARQNTDDGHGMRTVVKVSRVPDGDNALVLAADGVLGMFSVGAEPREFDFDAEGVMNVHAADWQHLALLPFGAFTDARVDSVAASPPQGELPMPTETVIADAQPPEVTAAQPQTPPPATIPIAATRPAAQPMTLQRFASLIASANRGEITTEAVRTSIQAALANITTTDVGSVVQPAYRSEITAIIDHGTPLLDVLAGSPLPPSGMSLEYPQWVAPPTTGIQAAEKTQITSTPVTMTMKTAPVVTIAGGNDISLQAVERSSPSFLESYLRAAAVDWGRKAEQYVLSILTPLAEVVPPGADFLANVQALLASLDPAQTPAGPLFIGMSYDVAIPLISVTQQNGPAFWQGNINFASMTPEVDTGVGVRMFVDWNLPAKTMIGGSAAAANVRKSAGAPADIRVIDVSLLGLDVGVYGYIAVEVEYPGALSIMTLL